MGTKLRHFFATKDDLIPVFDAFEAKQAVKYGLMGLHKSPNLTVYSAGRDIATLGSPAPYENAICGYSYLVALPTQKIEVRTCPQNAGGVRYAVDQLHNPGTITVSHGGFFGPDILLYGRVGTVRDDPIALRLYRAFSTAMTKRFRRIRAFWVGPCAAELLARGYRLTAGASCPREIDLVPESDSSDIV